MTHNSSFKQVWWAENGLYGKGRLSFTLWPQDFEIHKQTGQNNCNEIERRKRNKAITELLEILGPWKLNCHLKRRQFD